jgi:hypothetical protein
VVENTTNLLIFMFLLVSSFSGLTLIMQVIKLLIDDHDRLEQDNRRLRQLREDGK